jgi:hypothetical protein
MARVGRTTFKDLPLPATIMGLMNAAQHRGFDHTTNHVTMATSLSSDAAGTNLIPALNTQRVLWRLEPGAWSLEPGAWSLEPGAWSLELLPS